MNRYLWEMLVCLGFFLGFCTALQHYAHRSERREIRISIRLWITGVILYAVSAFSLGALRIVQIPLGEFSAIVVSIASMLAIWCAFNELSEKKINPLLVIIFSIVTVILEIIIDQDKGLTARRQFILSLYRALLLMYLSITLGNEETATGKVRHPFICLMLLLTAIFLGFRALYFAENVFHFGNWPPSHNLTVILQNSIYVMPMVPILAFVSVFLNKHLAELSRETLRATQLHNFYETVRQCNQAIVRLHNRKELLKKIAQICAERGNLDLVWIGSPDAEGWIDYEAAAGPAIGYLQNQKISISEHRPESRGAIGVVFRERRPVIYDEYDLFDPWSDHRNKYGLRSGAGLVFSDHKGTGCITFYSKESLFFTPERIDLLTGLVADLGNALNAIHIRHLRADALRHLRANRKLLNFALDSASDATWEWNLSTGAVVFSRKWRQMLGYTPEDLPNHIEAWEKLILPADVMLMHKKLDAYLARESAEYHHEFRILGKDNQLHWIRDTGIILSHDSNGRPLWMVGTMKVIDDEIKQQEILADSEKRFRLLAENSADLISRHDLSGVFVYASPSFQRILGYDEDELIGKPLQLFTHEEDLALISSVLKELAITPTDIRIEYQIRKKNGSLLWVESAIKTVSDDTQAKKFELQMSTRDISQKKHAEQSLLDHDQFLTSVISSQINGIIVTDASGTITFANNSAEKILDLKFKTLTGKNITDDPLGIWLDAEEISINPLINLLSQAIEKRQSIPEVEQGIRLVSGKIKWLSISASPLYSTQNILAGAVISFIDITERISARQIMMEQMTQLKLQHDAINGSNNGIAIADARSPDVPIIYSNKRFEIFSGMPLDETQGVSLYHISGDEVVHGPVKSLREAIEKRIDQTFILKSSQKNSQDFYYTFSLSVISDDDREATHLLAVLTDISEKIAARNELEQLTERLQLAISGANIGIIDIDLVNKRTHISEQLARRLALDSKKQEFPVRDLVSLIYPEDRSGVMLLAKRHLRNEIPYLTGEIRLKQKDNKWSWFSIRGKFIAHSITGSRRRFSGVLTDISERKEHELKIEELTHTVMTIAEKERAEISAELHDSVGQGLILTHLNILNHLKINNQRSVDTDEKLLQPLRNVLKTTREISRRLSPIHMREVGIRAALEEMIFSAAKIAELKVQLDLTAIDSFFADDWDIHCYRVIQEALTNTIKHANASVFSVTAERFDDLLILDISDDGTGTGETKAANGIGTLIMQERIRMLNGTLVADKNQFGFNIHIEIPNPASSS